MRSSSLTTPTMVLLDTAATYLLGCSTFSQLMRWMRLTPDTMNAVVTLLNSVTIVLGSSAPWIWVLPSHMLRSTSGMMRERRLKAPSTLGCCTSGSSVTLGMRMISSTLATLTP